MSGAGQSRGRKPADHAGVTGLAPGALILPRRGQAATLQKDAFHGLQTKPTEYGPMLVLERSEGIQGCIAYLGCRVTQKIAVGDHDLYVADVVAAASVNGAKPYTHLRTTGLSY